MKNALVWNVYLNQLYGITIESQEVNIFFGSPVSQCYSSSHSDWAGDAQCDLSAREQTPRTLLNSSYVAAINHQHQVLLVIRRVTGRKGAGIRINTDASWHTWWGWSSLKLAEWNLTEIYHVTGSGSSWTTPLFIHYSILLWAFLWDDLCNHVLTAIVLAVQQHVVIRSTGKSKKCLFWQKLLRHTDVHGL